MFGLRTGRRDPAPQHSTPFKVDIGRRIGIVLSHSMFRPTVVGREKVPTTGPLVFVANHTAFVDGAVLFGLLPRRVSFLIKAEAVKGALGWILSSAGQYSIRREAPQREVLLQAKDQLVAGGCIGVFPEGTRGDGDVAQVSGGAGWLAVRAGARVVPIGIRGTARPTGSGRRLRPRIWISIGEAFEVEPGTGKKAMDAATTLIQQRLIDQVRTVDAMVATQKKAAGR